MMQRRTMSLLTNRSFFIVTGGAAAVVVVTGLVAPITVSLVVIGCLIALLLGLTVARRDTTAVGSNLLQESFRIARHEEAFELHQLQTTALARCVAHGDPLFQSLAWKRLAIFATAVDEVSQGTIVYHDTESWRLAYEQLLRSPGLHSYRSVALITTSAYWRDEPGRRSMRLNYELQENSTLAIERTAIIADSLWAANDELPEESLRHWLHEQHVRGITLRLARLSELLNEPDLQTDFGIYGSRAVGLQETHRSAKTLRFLLSFDFERVGEAEERWDRLSVYATSYRDLLNQTEFDL